MAIDITAEELKTRINNGEKLNIIDVREVYEFEEKNINGILVPLGDLPGRLDDFDGIKNEEIIVHCKMGGRSASAKAYMEKNGYSNVRNLLGGIVSYSALN